jgi:hypothetical protein
MQIGQEQSVGFQVTTIEAVYFLETGERIDVGNYNGRGFAFRHMVKRLKILWGIEPSRG